MLKSKLLSTATENWHVPINPIPGMTPTFGQGAVYFINQNLQLEAVDYQAGQTTWTNSSIPLQPLQSPVWVRGVIYVASDEGLLYAVNPVTAASMWAQPVTVNSGAPLTTPQLGLGYVEGVGQQLVLYMMDAQNLYLVPLSWTDDAPPAPQTVFTMSGGTSFGVALVYDQTNGLFVVNTSNGLIALRPNMSGTSQWTQVWELSDLGGYCTPPVTAMGNVYVGTPGNTVAIVDIPSGSYVSSANLNSQLTQPMLVDPGTRTVFAATFDGIIHLLNANTGATSGSFQPGGQISTPLVLSDGIVYYGSADENVYGFDIINPTGDALAFQAQSPIVFVAGVSSGTVYLGTETNLHSVDFASLIHEFNSQSQLMVDIINPDQPQQVPAYQTHITLFDSQNNIRPNESVKMWSTSAATLMTDNQSFEIGPDTPACFQSDATGKLVLSVQANTNIQAGVASGLSTPGLLLWASFMDPLERILIYPDQRLHAKLQNISGSDLQTATSYNYANPAQPGPVLLPTGFQGGKGTQGRKNADSLASAINNIIALKPPSAIAEGPGNSSTRYLAFPESMLGVMYCATPPDTTRPAYPGAIPNWTLDLTSSSAVFTPQSSAEAVRQASASFRRNQPSGAPEFSFGGFSDFVNDVINGAEQALHTAWSDAEGEIQATIQSFQKSYQFVVHTVEDAAHVVLGILKSVLQDVENAIELIIEALSWLFAWEDILATHNHIKSLINNAFSQLPILIGQVETETDAFFDDLQSQIDSDLSSLIHQISGTTLGGTAQNYSDPNQTYSNGSDNYSVQGNWIFHKAMTSALGTNGSVTVGTPPLALATVVSQQRLTDAMLQFLETVAQDASVIAQNLVQLITDALNDLISLISDPASIRSAQLANLLGAIQNLADNLVQLGKAVANAFFTLLTDVAGTVQDALNTSIDIPIISWLYQLITGESLTILDLFCLIVAVPVTVVYKAITGSAPFSSARTLDKAAVDSVFPIVDGMIVSFNSFIYAFVDAISNAMGSNSPGFLNYFSGVLLAISQGASIPIGYTGGQMRDYLLLWIYKWFSTFWSVHCGLQASQGNQTSAVVLPFHGIGTAIWTGAYAIKYPTDFFDNGIKLAQNEVGALSTVAGVLKISSNAEVLAALVVVGLFFDITYAAIEIKYW